MSSQSFNLTSEPNLNTDLDNGFTSGMAIGHKINDKWSAELWWSYTSNEHNGSTSGSLANQNGNFASNIFGLASYYNFNAIKGFKPYVGLSLLITEEIDIDFESSSTEQSYSSGGDIGYGLTLGSKYDINDKYYIFGDLQYNYFSGLDLTNEDGTGIISNINYTPLALRIGFAMNF